MIDGDVNCLRSVKVRWRRRSALDRSLYKSIGGGGLVVGLAAASYGEDSEGDEGVGKDRLHSWSFNDRRVAVRMVKCLSMSRSRGRIDCDPTRGRARQT